MSEEIPAPLFTQGQTVRVGGRVGAVEEVAWRPQIGVWRYLVTGGGVSDWHFGHELESATCPLTLDDVEVLDEVLSDWQDLCSSAVEAIPGAADLVARLGAWLHEREAWRERR